MAARFLFFVLFICGMVGIIWFLINYLFKPEIKKTAETVEHNIEMRDIVVDKEINNMKEEEVKLKEELTPQPSVKKKSRHKKKKGQHI